MQSYISEINVASNIQNSLYFQRPSKKTKNFTIFFDLFAKKKHFPNGTRSRGLTSGKTMIKECVFKKYLEC